MLSKLTVWYNTRCPVCNAGIGWQRQRLVQAVRDDGIEFRDINLEPDALAHLGIMLESIRHRLHGFDSTEHLYVGLDGAIAIWQRTPRDLWLANLIDSPLIRSVSSIFYNRFADLLNGWNRVSGHWRAGEV